MSSEHAWLCLVILGPFWVAYPLTMGFAERCLDAYNRRTDAISKVPFGG